MNLIDYIFFASVVKRIRAQRRPFYSIYFLRYLLKKNTFWNYYEGLMNRTLKQLILFFSRQKKRPRNARLHVFGVLAQYINAQC